MLFRQLSGRFRVHRLIQQFLSVLQPSLHGSQVLAIVSQRFRARFQFGLPLAALLGGQLEIGGRLRDPVLKQGGVHA